MDGNFEMHLLGLRESLLSHRGLRRGATSSLPHLLTFLQTFINFHLPCRKMIAHKTASKLSLIAIEA